MDGKAGARSFLTCGSQSPPSITSRGRSAGVTCKQAALQFCEVKNFLHSVLRFLFLLSGNQNNYFIFFFFVHNFLRISRLAAYVTETTDSYTQTARHDSYSLPFLSSSRCYVPSVTSHKGHPPPGPRRRRDPQRPHELCQSPVVVRPKPPPGPCCRRAAVGRGGGGGGSEGVGGREGEGWELGWLWGAERRGREQVKCGR